MRRRVWVGVGVGVGVRIGVRRVGVNVGVGWDQVEVIVVGKRSSSGFCVSVDVGGSVGDDFLVRIRMRCRSRGHARVII
jgi:hypothetical protein